MYQSSFEKPLNFLFCHLSIDFVSESEARMPHNWQAYVHIGSRTALYITAVCSSLPAICDFSSINQPPQNSLHLSSNRSALSLRRYIVSTISSLRYIKQSTVFNEHTRRTKAVSRCVCRVYSSSLAFIYAFHESLTQ